MIEPTDKQKQRHPSAFVHMGRPSTSIKTAVDPGMKDETVALLMSGKDVVKIINLKKENTMEKLCDECKHYDGKEVCPLDRESIPKDGEGCDGFENKITIDHPSHYNQGKIEVIDFIEDQKLNFHLGNAIKYICRAGKKDPAKTEEDLRKAVWYINRYLEMEESK